MRTQNSGKTARVFGKLQQRAVALFCLLSLFLFSCQGRNRSPQKGTEAPPGKESSLAGESGDGLINQQKSQPASSETRVLPLGQQGGANPVSKPVATPLIMVDIPIQLYAIQSADPVTLYDFDMGPVEEKGAAYDWNSREIFKKVLIFFEALGKRKIKEELIHPLWRDILVKLLSYHIDRGYIPEGIRLGQIHFRTKAKDSCSAKIKVLGKEGWAIGELFLDKWELEWYISDIQLDFTELLKKSIMEDKFEPNIYQWLE